MFAVVFPRAALLANLVRLAGSATDAVSIAPPR